MKNMEFVYFVVTGIWNFGGLGQEGKYILKPNYWYPSAWRA
jgi:hypothetical protein